jgi:drug/metabolite transporter (DMT)-like permease
VDAPVAAWTRGLVRPGSATGLAFLGVVVLGGANAVAVRISTSELAPFWTATLRFAVAALVLLAMARVTRAPLPRGRALTGSILYGVVGFAGAFGCIHWAIAHLAPATAQTVLALVPLLTLLFAVGQRLERFSVASLVGSAIALVGVAAIFGDGLAASTPLAPLVAVTLGAACMAESNVIAKLFPAEHPVATNAVAMTVGAGLLLAASVVAGEDHALPGDSRVLGAILYVSLAGTVAVFSLVRYVLARWSASSTSTVMVLMPLVTIATASALTGASVTPGFGLGAGFVLAGVSIGTLRHRRGAGATSRRPDANFRQPQPGRA